MAERLRALRRSASFRALLVMFTIGLAIRLILAFAFFGHGDLGGFNMVGQRFLDSPIHSYAGTMPWVYPSGFLPWVAISSFVENHSAIPFHGFVQLLPIAADCAIAALVYTYLGWHRCPERLRLFAYGLVMLGPVFIAISGYHGQIDGVAILPAVIALMVWERSTGNRALWAGLLLGVGAAIKTVPLLLVIPLLVSVTSRREALTLVAAAVAVPVVANLPFFLAEPEAFRRASDYAGVPGRGGLSLLADPSFGAHRLQSEAFAFLASPNETTRFLMDIATVWTIALMAAVGAFFYRFRPSPLDGIVFLWLVVYCFSPNFLHQYLLWSMPFFLMSGYLKQVAALQLAMVPPLLIVYWYELNGPVFLSWVYVVIMLALWLAWLVCLYIVGRNIVRSRRKHPSGVQPPLREYPAHVAP